MSTPTYVMSVAFQKRLTEMMYAATASYSPAFANSLASMSAGPKLSSCGEPGAKRPLGRPLDAAPAQHEDERPKWDVPVPFR
jgi:hypothetical protein